VYWDVTLCRLLLKFRRNILHPISRRILVNPYRSFGEKCCIHCQGEFTFRSEDGGGTFLLNVDDDLTDCTAVHHKKRETCIFIAVRISNLARLVFTSTASSKGFSLTRSWCSVAGKLEG
jgi:hypothetical protein